jgi:transposase InsO family protein
VAVGRAQRERGEYLVCHDSRYPGGVAGLLHARLQELDLEAVPVPGSENGYIESFNGRLRDELLNAELFLDINDARRKIEAWRRDYNGNRPHTALCDMTPDEFAAKQRPSGEADLNRGQRSHPCRTASTTCCKRSSC